MLRRLNFHDSSVAKAVARQGLLAGVSYLTTFALLALRKPKFASVVDPDAADTKRKRKGKGKEEEEEGRVAGSGSLAPVRPAVAVVRGGGSGGAWRMKTGGSPLVPLPKIFL